MVLALALGGALPAAADFPLVAGGRAAPLVAEPQVSSDPELGGAIEDFREWVAASTGAKPDLLPPGRVDRPAIFLGRAAATPGLDAGEESLGPDGYVIRVEDKAIRVAGPTAGAVAHGLYDLARTAIGVQVHGPGPEDVLVPSHAAIRLPAGERRERPAFMLRQAWYNENVLAGYPPEERETLKRFARRHRGGGVRAVIRHYFADLVPPDKNFAEHPDYFAELHGKRVKDGQLCTSNPQVIRIAAEHWRNRFSREPDLRIGSLSPNDGDRFCTCTQCLSQGSDLTARMLRFMNEVTRQVAGEHPNRYLSFYAYSALVEPPLDRGNKLHANVIPVVARYSVCQVHAIGAPQCRSVTRFAQQLDGWSAIARQIMAREYACLWPVPDATYPVLAANLNIYRARGAQGVSREYLYRGFMSDLLMAADLELMWNPTIDPDSVMASLVNARFQESAPAVKAVMDELSATLHALPPDAVIVGDVKGMSEIYPPATLARGVEALDRAAQSANGIVQTRIQIEADRLRLAQLTVESTLASNRYKLSGQDADRSLAEQKLGSASALATRLVQSRLVGANGQGDLEQRTTALTAPGLKVPIPAGDFAYEDDMNRGGFSRRDADQLAGFYPGTYGLALNPGQGGRAAYTLTAESGHHFSKVELHKLIFRGSVTAIEVKVRGMVHQIGAGTRLDDRERIYDLTPLVNGAERFTITFGSRNSTDAAMLCLDHWALRGHVE